MHLATIVDRVATECDLEQSTIAQYRRAESRFSAWLGYSSTDADLTIENLNGFIAALQKRISGTTARNYRVSITRIWNYLTEHHNLPEYNVRRLRKPKIDKKPVFAWSPEQVTALLKGAQDMLGRLRCGIEESDFMTAWIWIGYDTGIRPIDLRLLKWSDLQVSHGTLAITQHKTRNPHSALMSEQAKHWLDRIVLPSRQLVFPLTKGGMRRLELKLYKESVRHGFTRIKGQGIGTLRKTHATEVYITDGECAAAESLGHVGGVRTVRASYIDHRAVRRGRLPNRPDVA